MVFTYKLKRIGETVSDVLGLRLKDLAGLDERIRHVRATTIIGGGAGLLFALFNLFTEGMFALGLFELAALVFLLIPAGLLASQPGRIDVAEGMILAATLVIMGALIVFGGIDGTGLFWIYTVPFLAFFLKGQRAGWWYSLGFLVLVTLYFFVLMPLLPFAFRHQSTIAIHFLLSLSFYTIVAAAFNQLRSRFEQKLQQRVDEKTADAQVLLAELQFLATHDALTKLPNRVLLLNQLETEMAAVQATGQQLWVCNLRLERLLEMGNVLGLEGSDNLIRSVSVRLAQISGGHGHLARTRRDEFVILYRAEPATFSPERLQQFIGERQFSVEQQGDSLFVEFTLGLAIYPSHTRDAKSLLNKAEQAMLQARKNGQQWMVYDEQQDQVFVRHHLLFGKLREALLQQQLHVFYQPKIDLKTGRVVGAEALARWNDPASGMIPPIEFIPVAEASGLIYPFTTWLLSECMQECARWVSKGLDLNLSINLSPRNLLDADLLNTLQTALHANALAPGSITLEITESCFMTSPERAMEAIKRIHDAGFKLSIDDFGTGYSSLSYLKNLPIAELKIDQSFVRKLLNNPGDQAIVSSTIDLAHNLHLSVVAEGIEDELTTHWLYERGCDVGQGYFYARPMPANDFLVFAQASVMTQRLDQDAHEAHSPQ